jgi:hypothetical protein
MTGKDLEGSGHGLILRHCPCIYLEGLRKTMKTHKTHSQDSWSLGQDLNSVPPEYEA